MVYQTLVQLHFLFSGLDWSSPFYVVVAVGNTLACTYEGHGSKHPYKASWADMVGKPGALFRQSGQYSRRIQELGKYADISFFRALRP